jgi:hypothetical protein
MSLIRCRQPPSRMSATAERQAEPTCRGRSHHRAAGLWCIRVRWYMPPPLSSRRGLLVWSGLARIASSQRTAVSLAESRGSNTPATQVLLTRHCHNHEVKAIHHSRAHAPGSLAHAGLCRRGSKARKSSLAMAPDFSHTRGPIRSTRSDRNHGTHRLYYFPKVYPTKCCMFPLRLESIASGRALSVLFRSPSGSTVAGRASDELVSPSPVRRSGCVRSTVVHLCLPAGSD